MLQNYLSHWPADGAARRARDGWWIGRRLAGALILAAAVLVLGHDGPLQAAAGAPGSPPAAAAPGVLGALLGRTGDQPGPVAPAGAPASATPGVYLQEGFEGSDLGNGVFTPTLITATPTPTGAPGWTVVTTSPHTGTFAAFVPDADQISDARLTSLYPVTIPANATSAVLSFWHHYDLQGGGFDGAVLEASIDGGATWRDVLSATTFISGGYTGQVRPETNNPLGNRQAWINSMPSYGQVQVDLLPYQGHDLLVRFRLGTDNSQVGNPAGWWVDDVTITIDAPCGLGSWDVQSPYPNTIAGSAGAVFDGQIYSFGGSVTSGPPYTTQAERYDPATHVWVPVATMPAARGFQAAATDGTSIYLAGGFGAADVSEKSFWRYDPASDSYTPLASLVVSSTAGSAVYLDGKIYLVGGEPEAGMPGHTVQVYTIATDSWALSAAPYPIPIAAAAAVVLDGAIYVAAGLTTAAAATAFTASYDPASNTWTNDPDPAAAGAALRAGERHPGQPLDPGRRGRELR